MKGVIMNDYLNAAPSHVRALIREGKLVAPTTGFCSGYAQGNLAVLPKKLAYDFLLFAQRNPKPCPLLEVSDEGSREFSISAPGSDIARDIGMYRVYRHGKLEGEYEDVSHLWQEDFVSFLIGCSFTFEHPLMDADIRVRHIDEGRNVPMYITNIKCTPAGIFDGPTVCSMRPIPHGRVADAVTITARYANVHGAPLHIGSPDAIGIKDINSPDFGDAVRIEEGETPVFWACGVTPQAVAMHVKPEIMITHSPGYMFITDIKDSRL